MNGHGRDRRGGDVIVDARLNSAAGSTFEVIANTEQSGTVTFTGPHPVGQQLPVRSRDGAAYLEIRDVGPSEVLVLVNR